MLQWGKASIYWSLLAVLTALLSQNALRKRNWTLLVVAKFSDAF